jgi:hypothetical protein
MLPIASSAWVNGTKALGCFPVRDMAKRRTRELSDQVVGLAALLAPALGGATASPGVPDMEAARFAIHRHRVGPLLYGAVGSRKDRLDPGVYAMLEKNYRDNVESQTRALLVTTFIARRLAQAGVDWLELKGCPQASRLYSDPAYRASNDIDILVAPRDFRRATAALREAGFAPKRPPLMPDHPLAPLAYGVFRDIMLAHPSMPFVIVELHQRPFFASGRRATAQRFTRSPQAAGDAPQVPALDSAMAFYIVAHGALSHWARLKWLVDLVPLLAKLSDADKAGLIEQARAARAETSLAASLVLLEDLFPYAELGVLRPWLDARRDKRGIGLRRSIYERTISAATVAKNTPLYSSWETLRAGWLFFEAPSTRARLLTLGPFSSALKAVVTRVAHKERLRPLPEAR